MFEDKVFWKDGFEGEAKGGLHFRSFELNKFMRQVESSKDSDEVVGIQFSDNNLELILKKS